MEITALLMAGEMALFYPNILSRFGRRAGLVAHEKRDKFGT